MKIKPLPRLYDIVGAVRCWMYSGYSDATPRRIDFGIKDRLGREVGIIVRIYPVRFEVAADPTAKAPSEACYSYAQLAPAGTIYRVNYCAARDGRLYQASHEADFYTMQEANAYAAERIELARKSAAKKLGRIVRRGK